MVVGSLAAFPFPARGSTKKEPPGAMLEGTTLPLNMDEGSGAKGAKRARGLRSSCPDNVPRASKDRSDLSKGPQIHVVYLVSSDFPDEGLDTRGVLNCSVQAWNGWFETQADGLRWRLDLFRARGSDVVDVTFVHSDRPGSELQTSTSIGEELARAGLDDPNKKYLSYVAADAGSLCGSGQYPLIELSDPLNPFGGHGRYAQVFLFSHPGCHAHDFGVPGGPSWVEAIAMQELLHTEAVVPFGAPHSCTGVEAIPTHVCTPGLGHAELVGVHADPEGVDVMFPFANGPLAGKLLDRDRDDYFGHSLPIRDLADSPFLTNR